LNIPSAFPSSVLVAEQFVNLVAPSPVHPNLWPSKRSFQRLNKLSMDQPLFQAFFDQAIQADTFLLGFEDRAGMQAGGNPQDKFSTARLLRPFSPLGAKFKIIFDAIAKSALKLLDRRALKGDDIFQSEYLSMENFCSGIEAHLTGVSFIL
jgi:hypothetical protein